MDLGMALRRKVIIHDMSIEGIAFGLDRSSSGAISSGSKPSKKSTQSAKNDQSAPADAPKQAKGQPQQVDKEEPSLFSLSTPDVKEILKSEDLNSLRMASELEQEINAAKKRFEARSINLPDKSSVNKYKRRIKEAVEGKTSLQNISKRARQLEAINKDIKNDINQIENTMKDIEKTSKSLRQKLKLLKQAPKDDINRLLKKYSLTPEGLGNMSNYFFSAKVKNRIKDAVRYYESAKPYIEQYKKRQAAKPKHERGKGTNVKFTEHDPKPDFLIELADAFARLPYGTIGGNLKNVTNEQHITGVPTTFEFKSNALKGIESIELKGTLDHRKPADSTDTIFFNSKGVSVSNMELSTSEDFPVSIEDALMDVHIKGTISNGEMVTRVIARFKDVNIKAGNNIDSALAKTLSSALESVEEFSLTADLTGPVMSPSIKISSNLDKIMKDAAGKAVKKQAQKFRGQLEAEVLKKTEGKISQIKGSLGSLSKMRNKLNTNRKGLKGAIDDATKAQRRQGEDAFKNKLKGLF
jgi:uncharacterized protein (TIGR03545 family)